MEDDDQRGGATTGSSSVLWLRYVATERTPALAGLDPTTGQVRISARNVSPSATRIGDSVIDSVLVVDDATDATLRTAFLGRPGWLGAIHRDRRRISRWLVGRRQGQHGCQS